MVFASATYRVRVLDKDVRCRLIITMHCGEEIVTKISSKNEVWAFAGYWLNRLQSKARGEVGAHVKSCKVCKKHQPKVLT